MDILKGLVLIYDVGTLPLYAAVQRPWNQRRRAKAVRAKQTNPNDPYSAWIRVGTPTPSLADNCATVDENFRRAVREYSDKRCLGYRETLNEEDEKQQDGKVLRKKIMAPDYKWVSYAQMDKRVDDIMRGLLLNGVKPKDKVLIFMETRMEWMLTAQALYRMGATLATLYATLGDEATVHGINEIEATHIVTTSDLITKLKKLQEKIPKVNHIIYVEVKSGKGPFDYSEGFKKDMKFISHEALEKQGSQASPDLKGVAPEEDDLALVMYTSGSTGTPKGVMASHKNLMEAIRSFNAALTEIANRKGGLKAKDVYVAYLPLAHCLEFAAENVLISMGLPIGYSTPGTLTDKSPAIKSGSRGDANVLKPCGVAAVPLVLDRIRKGVQETVEKKGKTFKKVFDFAIEYKHYWNAKGYRTPIVNFLFCRKMKASLGGNVKFMFCGGAPLSPETQSFAKACLDVEILQGYGLTETTALCTLMDIDDVSFGRTGAPMFGSKVKLVDWVEGNYRATDKPNPRGEIVIGGGAITSGYFKNSTSDEVYKDEDGIRWFYSGDIGEMYPDGTLKIIDRKKDLLKLQFGEYVSLGRVEAELKSCPYIENICVYGDPMQTFLVALVSPNQSALKGLAIKLGIDSSVSFNSLCLDPEVCADVSKQMHEFGNLAGFQKWEMPFKMKLCREEWTPDSGLVTAALKIRRRQIEDFYRSDINRMYGIIDANYNKDKNRNTIQMTNGSGNDNKAPEVVGNSGA